MSSSTEFSKSIRGLISQALANGEIVCSDKETLLEEVMVWVGDYVETCQESDSARAYALAEYFFNYFEDCILDSGGNQESATIPYEFVEIAQGYCVKFLEKLFNVKIKW